MEFADPTTRSALTTVTRPDIAAGGLERCGMEYAVARPVGDGGAHQA